MKDFLFIFRRDETKLDTPSPQQMEGMMKNWQDWMGSIAAQNKLVNSGNRLATDGKVVKPGNIITDGPYVEVKESIGGYIVVRAESADEAAQLATGCPILNVGGNVEVRALVSMDGKG